MLIERLAVIGVGLIGGSLALALKRAQQCGTVIGCGRNSANLDTAVTLGVIDSYSTNLGEAVTGADMVVLAVPLGSMRDTFAAIRPHLAPHAIITDVGSAKASVVQAAQAELGSHFPRFVAGHPIAGAEKSGAQAAQADLFKNRRVILTPTPDTEPSAHARVTQMWRETGAAVEDMEMAHHDAILAATSHLPHMLAYALVDLLAQSASHGEIFRYAAGGFRDFTRIAASDPQMWHDICVANRDPLVQILTAYEAHLHQLTQAIQAGDGPQIKALFQRAKQTRDQING